MHSEADKFIIANEASNDEKVKKAVKFDYLEDGEPEIFEPDYSNIKGLNDNRKNYFPRKEEI